MFSPSPFDRARPFLTWQRIMDWAQEHYRSRTFNKDERIPARPGIVYLVDRGAIRLISAAQTQGAVKPKVSTSALSESPQEEAFLGFVGAGQPFEIITQSPFDLRCFAHVDQTEVIWLYWNDLDNWPHFRREVLDAFRYQHQRKLLWLATLGQRRTIDRLLGFLTLLIEEFGAPYEHGYYLPWSLTHAQIGSAIGSTRVTVTRLMGKLRQQGLIKVHGEGFIAIPSPSKPKSI
ncbi:replication/maintenance protein [filamentous cyanobacterium CCP5]|nr:replication/maintenance protein [filamentous cyanobacterium CCP5]